MSDKKDLTDLNDLFPDLKDLAAPAGTENPGETLSLAPDSAPLEGLEDLLSPMGPGDAVDFPTTFPNANEDPIAGLPPIDPEVEALAFGHDESPLAPPAENLIEEPTPPTTLDDPAPLLTTGLEDPILLDEPVAPLAETAVGAAISSALNNEVDPAHSSHIPNMGDLKNYSEKLAPAANRVLAATPYSLLIEGPLKVHEREALLQILSRENLGIREVELEPQFQSNRVLIPRISEYAGVLIVQALRTSNALMRLGPSERIFVAKDADDGDALIFASNPDTELLLTEEGETPIDSIVLSPESGISGRKVLETLDTIHVSMNLKAAHVSHPQSPLFQDSLEKLKRQIKFQAHHRGANALLSFKYELHPLEGQTIYKLVVQATAVKLG